MAKRTDADSVFKLEVVPVASLRDHPRNYRQHPDDQLDHVIESIKEHGFYRNVVVAKDGTILAGHGVVAACRRMKMENIPVVRLNLDPESPSALKMLTGDNEISHMGVVDDRLLSDILKDIKLQAEGGLLGTGFDDMMLANLVFITRPVSEIGDIDQAKQWAGMPDFSLDGPEWQIVVSFRHKKDVKKFAELLKVRVTEDTKSIWYPQKPRDPIGSMKFVEGKPK